MVEVFSTLTVRKPLGDHGESWEDPGVFRRGLCLLEGSHESLLAEHGSRGLGYLICLVLHLI